MICLKKIGNILSQWYPIKWWRKFRAETLKKVFSNEKKWLQERSSSISSTQIFFMFILLLSNHMVFLVQFGINYHLRVFKKAEIALAKAARVISAFWKPHLCKLILNWTRNRMIMYTYYYYYFKENDQFFKFTGHVSTELLSSSVEWLQSKLNNK